MWVVNFVVVRDGERSREDGSPREFLSPGSPFPLPDIDQTVIHRGEQFVVDDVIWDLERSSVTVELVSPEEAESQAVDPTAEEVDDEGIEVEDDEGIEVEDDESPSDKSDESDGSD